MIHPQFLTSTLDYQMLLINEFFLTKFWPSLLFLFLFFSPTETRKSSCSSDYEEEYNNEIVTSWERKCCRRSLLSAGKGQCEDPEWKEEEKKNPRSVHRPARASRQASRHFTHAYLQRLAGGPKPFHKPPQLRHLHRRCSFTSSPSVLPCRLYSLWPTAKSLYSSRSCSAAWFKKYPWKNENNFFNPQVIKIIAVNSRYSTQW